MYSPFNGERRTDPPLLKQLRVFWRMQGPRSVLVAALYEHPQGHELRIYFERSEDAIVQTFVERIDVGVLEAKAEQLRGVLLEQGWLPIPHETPSTH